MRKTLLALTMALTFALHAPAQTPEFRVLHNFGSSQDGSVPSGPLSRDAKGNLYGATGGGPGEYGYGTAFELKPEKNGSWAEEILYDFTAGSDGAFPWGGLTLGTSGTLYGTLEGSTNAVGAVFALSPNGSGWTYDLLYTAGRALADGPGVVLDNMGNLYGDIGQGQDHLGAIGELSPGPDGWTYTQLYNYCSQYDCPDGDGEPAPPIWDRDGNLWGVTSVGGINSSPCVTEEGCGVIFKMTPNGDGTWTYHVVHRFASSPTDGQFPLAGLTLDSDGNFYGDTDGGGTHSAGTIFKFSEVDGRVKRETIYDFADCSTGCYPEGTLAIDEAGNLYGMAQGGTNSCGGFSCGVIFKLARLCDGSYKYSMLVNLEEHTGGAFPFYGLILDKKGNLYGVTSSFGKYGGGTAFEITQ